MGYSLDFANVRGDLFAISGKWKYTVQLDYTGLDYDNPDLWGEARSALRNATARRTSGVTLATIPDGWTLVVLEPYSRFSHPITVEGLTP